MSDDPYRTPRTSGGNQTYRQTLLSDPGLFLIVIPGVVVLLAIMLAVLFSVAERRSSQFRTTRFHGMNDDTEHKR